MKKSIITLFLLCVFVFIQNDLVAQPPAAKYDNSNYPEDRKAIDALNYWDTSAYLNDDYIAVGPEGKISYGYEQWKNGFGKDKAVFKSVTPVPGMAIMRIYNGDAAVRHSVLDVVFTTPNGELSLKVIRNETFIKRNGKWYFVQGQGTQLVSEDEFKKAVENAQKSH
jgi:hypothetical protein